jgi:hypothetical protein
MHHLFDAKLRNQDGMLAVAQLHDVGNLVGSGTGHIEGPARLRGTLRWSNYERSQLDYCQLTLTGTIETEDGATIQFESRGFALRPEANKWKIVAAMHFVVGDPRYRW